MSESEKERTIQRIDLSGTWEFRRIRSFSGDQVPVKKLDSWMPASVPGTVHTDLMALRKIPDPFFRDEEIRVQWVGESDWEYRKIFHVGPDILDCFAVELVCEGLDTIATLAVNSNEIGRSENMFIAHRFDLKKSLKAGENEIRILFSSPVRTSQDLEKKGGQLTSSRHSSRVYIRKTQCSFGWDWGPSLPTSGIWRPIFIEGIPELRIVNCWVRVLHLSEKKAHLEMEVEIRHSSKMEYRFLITIDGRERIAEKQVWTSQNRFHCVFDIPDPELWWPCGFGQPFLYLFRVQAFQDECLLDEFIQRFGIRTVSLRLVDEKGKPCFRLEVNGTAIFCRGADWIPADSFLPRVKKDQYLTLLTLANEAHMNMLRVWGGGIIEDPVFYKSCDELGIMVWQDFMFACSGYPEEAGFVSQVQKEAEWVIKQLRNHPSVVLWCGNNENEWVWQRETGKPVEEMPGYPIFHRLIPNLCEKLDPSRPYWPTTPWGGEDPNSALEGNRHQWDIWSEWEDFTQVKNDTGLFITEFGFQAPANLTTLRPYFARQELHPQNRIFAFHEKQDEGIERLFRYLAGHMEMTTEFSRFVYATQVNQAEALKCCVEHWRRRKFRTAGTLIWQLNDCWPVIGWSLIDYRLIPKASYYFAKRFFNDVLLSYDERDGKTMLVIVNDTPGMILGRLDVWIQTFYGEPVISKSMNVSVQPNGISEISVFETNEMGKINRESTYSRAILKWGNGQKTEASCVFDRYKNIQFPRIALDIRIQVKADPFFTVEMRAPALVKCLYLDIPGYISDDNYLDIHPNDIRVVRFTRHVSRMDASRRPVAYSLIKGYVHPVNWIS